MTSPGAPRPVTSWVKMSFIGLRVRASVPSLALASRARVRQQRHLARVLDRGGDVALVLRAVTGNPPRADLAAVGNKLPQQPGVLVVHPGHPFLAEKADLLLGLTDRWLGHRGAPSQSRHGAGMVGRAPPAAGMVGWLLVTRYLSERRLVGKSAVTGRLGGPRV